MSHIFLVRHGEVAGNSAQAGGRLTFAGWSDKALTTRGMAQAQAVAARLSTEKLTAIYSSDLQRARVTAQRIAERHDLEVRIDSRLREVNYGAWENLGLEEILADYADVWNARNADPEFVAPPDGESYAALWARLAPCWNEILALHGDEERVAVVAHNGTIRILLCQLLGMPVAHFKRLHTANCGVSHLEIKRAPRDDIEYSNGEFEVVARFINDSSHLNGI